MIGFGNQNFTVKLFSYNLVTRKGFEPLTTGL